MPPKAKAKRAPSPGPKAKAKAKAKEEAPDPKELLLKEGKEMFEKYRDEDAGVKLKGFAQCIRDMNIKKCQPWTDDEIGPTVIKAQWNSLERKEGKEAEEKAFVEWWPTFVELVEAKQAEITAAEEKKAAEKAEQAAAKAGIYDSDGVWNIPLTDMVEAINKAYEKGRTPLIIDNTENFRAETFFAYSDAHIVECKKWIVEKAKGKSVEDLLSDQRDTFFLGKCYKYGKTVVFRLANSAADIKSTFNSEVFPSLSLLDAKKVKSCIGPDNAANWNGSAFQKMCKDKNQEEDCEFIGINENFKVIAITQFKEEDYVGFLEKMFPLDMCQPIKPSVAA